MAGSRRAAVLTISDGVFHGTRTDDSGRVLAEALAGAGFEVAERQVVQDDRRDIEPALVSLAANHDLVVTTGGTGLGPRDVTPEATRAVIEREAPGFAEAMRADGRSKTPMAILSRGISGVRGESLIVNFPGSPKACLEGLQVVLPLFGHALDLITGNTQHTDGPPQPKDRPGESDKAGGHAHHDHSSSGHDHDRNPRGHDAAEPASAAPSTAAQADPAWEVTSTLARRIEQGEDSLLATAIRRDGAPPCSLGQKMLLGPGGPLAGTLGCSDFDTAIANEAAKVIAGGRSTVRTLQHDLGTIDVYLEPYTRRPRLVVVGATPVALWLLRWGRDLGYEPILVEDRPDWVTAEHREAATRVQTSADGMEPAGQMDVVHTDHESPSVADQIAALLPLHPRFVGIIGSARHTGGHLAKLAERGLDPEQIARIQSPVGLNLGAKTPPEIALSILAGLMRHRTGRGGEWLDPKFETGARAVESPDRALAGAGAGQRAETKGANDEG
ncbi:MAG TPA: molybdenum cofactor synthesis domain-containing protein [Actinomycetota bacterium]|nr:molybdenum cofactor synthesis domain-containing protein [Actinomycetota bacterium]